MFTDNVIDIMPYILKKREKAATQDKDVDVMDIIEDLTRYVDAYKFIQES